MKVLKDFTAVPFAQLQTAADYADRHLYVYYYAPVILTAIEKEIGEKKMWHWLSIMLQTKTELTDYAFMEQTLAAALKDKKRAALLKIKYFNSAQSLQHAIETIIQN